jgi:hypothetical protein
MSTRFAVVGFMNGPPRCICLEDGTVPVYSRQEVKERALRIALAQIENGPFNLGGGESIYVYDTQTGELIEP